MDVVSGGELYTAIQAGFPAEQIEFNGNNKSIDELALAIDYGVGRIIVDGSQEIGLIRGAMSRETAESKVMFRNHTRSECPDPCVYFNWTERFEIWDPIG